jgi:DNA-binding NarL/FixJ family response regulator
VVDANSKAILLSFLSIKQVDGKTKTIRGDLPAQAAREQTRRERQAAGIAIAKRNGVYQGRKAGTLKADAARALALRSKGLNDTEIAAALGVARRTVRRYLHA